MTEFGRTAEEDEPASLFVHVAVDLIAQLAGQAEKWRLALVTLGAGMLSSHHSVRCGSIANLHGDQIIRCRVRRPLIMSGGGVGDLHLGVTSYRWCS